MTSSRPQSGKRETETTGLLTDEKGLERLVFFSDAVFAIAITLLVINIQLPSNAGADLLGAFGDVLPKIVSFVISFLVIGLYWVAHHQMFRSVRRYDYRFVWLNLFLLMSIAFLPFSTEVIGTYGDQTVGVIFYAASLALAGILFMLVWLYAVHNHRLIEPDLPYDHIRNTTARIAVAPAVFLLSIPIALIRPSVAEWSWVLIFVLLRLLRRPGN
jgi:uncharacterized membrane protein